MSEPESITRLHPLMLRRLRSGGEVIYRSTGNPLTIANILECVPDLNMNGFRAYRTGPGGTSDAEHEKLRHELLNHQQWAKNIIGLPSEARLRQLSKWQKSFEPARQWTRSTSYSLKHVFERETGIYVPDGLFIVGVLMAGFEAKFWNDSPSAVFRMRRRAVR
jgi:hypothetical protein